MLNKQKPLKTKKKPKPPNNTKTSSCYVRNMHVGIIIKNFFFFFFSQFLIYQPISWQNFFFTRMSLSNLFSFQESHLDTAPSGRWYRRLLLELRNRQHAELLLWKCWKVTRRQAGLEKMMLFIISYLTCNIILLKARLCDDRPLPLAVWNIQNVHTKSQGQQDFPSK